MGWVEEKEYSMNDRIKKLVAKSTIIALCASVLAGRSAFAKNGDINNIKVKYGNGEEAASTLTKNVSRRNGFVNLKEDANSRWITARMKKGKKVKKSYVAGSVVLQEGTSATFTNSGVANTNYTLYITRTYKGNNPVSYVNGYWRADY